MTLSLGTAMAKLKKCIKIIAIFLMLFTLHNQQNNMKYIMNIQHMCVRALFLFSSCFVCSQLLSASKVTLRLTVVRRCLYQMFVFWGWRGMKKQMSVQIRKKKAWALRAIFCDAMRTSLRKNTAVMHIIATVSQPVGSHFVQMDDQGLNNYNWWRRIICLFYYFHSLVTYSAVNTQIRVLAKIQTHQTLGD